MMLMAVPKFITRVDPVIERYMCDVDRSLLRRNLALTHQERLDQLQKLALFADELRRAGKSVRLDPTR
jgi:hypothetical protein